MKARGGWIWSAGDWQGAYYLAVKRGRGDLVAVLSEHHFHADHCGGYDVAAWPCAPAKKALDELLGGEA